MSPQRLAEVTGIPLPARPKLVPATKMLERAGPPDFLIQGLMEKDTYGVLFGKWGAGKSLVALDWALRISLGLPVQGRKTEQGPVVYVVGEGHGGIARRIAAWQALTGYQVNDLLVFTEQAVPIGDEQAVQLLHQEIRAHVARWGRNPAAIFSDTLARNFGPGDENSNSDMGQHVMMVDRWLRTPFGATVLELHHPGHQESERGRGASALPAACDFEYRLEASGPELTLATTKTKDFEPPPALRYRIEPVKLSVGTDEFGHPTQRYESAAVSESGEVADSGASGEVRDEALDVLRAIYRDHQDTLDAAALPVEQARVSTREWRVRLVEEGILSGKYAKQDFYKIRQRLQKAGSVRFDGRYVYL